MINYKRQTKGSTTSQTGGGVKAAIKLKYVIKNEKNIFAVARQLKFLLGSQNLVQLLGHHGNPEINAKLHLSFRKMGKKSKII